MPGVGLPIPGVITPGLPCLFPLSVSGVGLLVATPVKSNPIPDLCRWLYGRMAGDALLAAEVGGPESPRIHKDVAPQESVEGEETDTYPFVIFSIVSAGHTTGNGALRGPTHPMVQITGHTVGEDVTALETLAHRIDDLFTGRFSGLQGSLKISGGHGVGVLGDSETVDGVTYQRVGGVYRLFCFY